MLNFPQFTTPPTFDMVSGPIPRVDLTYPEREPTDEELEALMQSASDKAVERSRRAHERFFAKREDSVARAAQSRRRG